MSETDDTDILLLIPPDFFSIEKTDVPQLNSFEKSKNKELSKSLLGRVRSLESRIETLEQNSSVDNRTYSNISTSSESSGSLKISSLSRNHKFKKIKPSILSSREKSLFENMDKKDKDAPISVDSDDRSMLKDIEHYLNKVEPNYSKQGDCNSNFDKETNARSNILEKYIYLTENENCDKNINDFLEETVSTVKSREISPLKSCFMKNVHSKQYTPRKLNYQQEKNDHGNIESSTPLKHIISNYNDRVCPRSIEQFQGNDSHKNADSFLSLHDTQLTMPHLNTELISLTDLWGKGAKSDITKKLEEEIVKRKHCEDLVQNLQRLLLEKEENIAVAMKIDSAKDDMINKLREACKQLTQSLKTADDHYNQLVEQTNSEKDKLKEIKMEAEQKSKYYENELYKALDLAHDYQDKYKNVASGKDLIREDYETKLKDLNMKLAEKDKELSEVKEKLSSCLENCQQKDADFFKLEEALQKSKEEINSLKSSLNETKNEKVKLEEQNSLLVNEKDILKQKTIEERARCEVLVNQIHDLQQRLSATSKREDSLELEVKTLQSQLDVQKYDLKCYYQKQLEDAVLAKIKVFQEQLDYAERSMENDVREKEQMLNQNYNKKIEKIIQQHQMEVSLLEEKQAEETKLYRLQIAQGNVKIKALEGKLESLVQRRGQIASQLHELMEKQWRQAVHILLNNVQSGQTSLQNTLSDRVASALNCDNATGLNSTNLSAFPFQVPNVLVPNKKQDYESSNSTNRMENAECLSDSELHYYVKMLLKKPPSTSSNNQPSGEAVNYNNNSLSDIPTSDRQREPEKPTKHTSKSNKPPWKS